MQSLRSKKSEKGFTLVEIMIVVLIIGILLAIAIPNFVQARETSRAKSCVANLKQLDSGLQQWAMDQKKPSTYAPTAADLAALAPTYIRNNPVCPSNGTYAAPADLTKSPTCSISAPGTGDYAKGDSTVTPAVAAGKWAHSL